MPSAASIASKYRRELKAIRLEHANSSQRTVLEPPGDIVEFWRAHFGTNPDPWQLEYLQAAMVHSDIAVVASRQSGKSTVVAMLCAFLMLHNPGFRIVVLSRTLAQAAEFTRRVTDAAARYVPRKAMPVTNRLGLMLPNEAFLVCVPCRNPESVRGFSPHFIIIDEAAFVPETTYTSIAPSRAATQGALHMISSPNGRVGFFFEAVEGRSKEFFWTRRVVADECPRITPTFLAQMRVELGETKFKQEFYSLFIEAEGAFFPTAAIEAFEEPDDLPGFEDVDYASIAAEIDDIKAAYDRRARVDDHGRYRKAT